MASSSNRSEGAHTLPRPELNPLLNPLLGEHMGRWAEVYFTAPPEKREEAVLELLRELESENPSRELATSSPDTSQIQQAEDSIRALESAHQADLQKDLQHCSECGHRNPLGHQFCGMCGASLVNSNTWRPEGYSEAANDDQSVEEDARPYQAQDEGIRARAEGSRRDPYDLSLFQSFREGTGYEDFEDDEQGSSHRLRYYFAAVLAILILGLGYIAWRGAIANQNADDSSPLPPPPAAANTVPAPADAGASASSPAPQKAEEPAPSPAPTNTAAPSSTAPPDTSVPSRKEPSRLPEHKSPAAKPPVSAESAANPAAPLTSGNGSEELAIAQRYLTGANGQRRDPSEAAKWLWKSMGKHNSAATLLLADLYLKGEGVAKNCDQARLLLDSAASKGMAGAGARLRNLQAFGCQ